MLPLSRNLMKLRVIVAESYPDFLHIFVSLLSTEFEVVATAVNGESALRCIRHWRPDVVILAMPGADGFELIKKVTSCAPRLGVVICSLESDPELVEVALQVGAQGYVLKTQIATDLVPAVKSVASGRRFVFRG